MCVTRLSAVERLKELASLRQWSSQGSELNSSFLSKYSSLSFILATVMKLYEKFPFLGDLRAVWPRISKYAKVARKYYGVNLSRKIKAYN